MLCRLIDISTSYEGAASRELSFVYHETMQLLTLIQRGVDKLKVHTGT
jgi:hypothetical protein